MLQRRRGKRAHLGDPLRAQRGWRCAGGVACVFVGVVWGVGGCGVSSGWVGDARAWVGWWLQVKTAHMHSRRQRIRCAVRYVSVGRGPATPRTAKESLSACFIRAPPRVLRADCHAVVLRDHTPHDAVVCPDLLCARCREHWQVVVGPVEQLNRALARSEEGGGAMAAAEAAAVAPSLSGLTQHSGTVDGCPPHAVLLPPHVCPNHLQPHAAPCFFANYSRCSRPCLSSSKTCSGVALGGACRARPWAGRHVLVTPLLLGGAGCWGCEQGGRAEQGEQ
jgi:hypothetical protein